MPTEDFTDRLISLFLITLSIVITLVTLVAPALVAWLSDYPQALLAYIASPIFLLAALIYYKLGTEF